MSEQEYEYYLELLEGGGANVLGRDQEVLAEFKESGEALKWIAARPGVSSFSIQAKADEGDMEDGEPDDSESVAQEAKRLGCSGTHMYEGKLMPCASHEEYLRLQGAGKEKEDEEATKRAKYSQEAARAMAKEMGCEGTHQNDVDGDTRYFPCKDRETYLAKKMISMKCETEEEATKKAESLGCKGTHMKDGEYYPCKDQEEFTMATKQSCCGDDVEIVFEPGQSIQAAVKAEIEAWFESQGVPVPAE